MYWNRFQFFTELFQVLAEDPERFKSLVKTSIVRQVTAINKLSDAGMCINIMYFLKNN